MKILITGHKGFIGKNMVQAFKDHELTFYEWGDKEPTIKGLDWCVHLGAISATTESNIDKVLTQNYDFSCWLLQECDSYSVNLQYASSASVYGLSKVFKEDGPLSPQSPYAWSKFLFDRHVSKFKDKLSITVQGFRYFNVYGPHEDHKGSQASPYHTFTQQAKKTGIIKLFKGSENYLRDFVPVEQVIAVHKKFLNVKESGIWNIGTGRPTSFASVARMISEKYHARVEYIDMPENIAKQYQTYTCADLTKLKRHYKI